MDTVKLQLFAGFVILVLIIIGTVLYIVTDHYWQAEQRRIAEKKCKEYLKYACDHPAPSNSSGHIIQGELAPLGMYPHMAFVQFVDMNDQQIKRSCGGSLISENFVLSAAHCAYGLRNIAGIAKLGSVNRNVTNDTGELYKVKRLYMNPFYRHSSGVNDYLLLELNRKVEFTPTLRPICLNTEYVGKYDNRIIATGWGRTEDANFSSDLRTVDLVIDGDVAEICPKALRTLATYFICAGFPNASKSVHQGDSGGPLQIPADSECANTYVQIGVTSMVQNRTYIANKTLLSFYAIVANAVPWIASIVWPDESA